jgi:amidase
MDDATELLARLAAGETSSRALLDAAHARMTRHEDVLNIVVAQDVEGARRRADEADAAREAGESWGPLHGLPITIKDSYEVVGMPATSGATELEDHIPAANAVAVQKLVDAGAIVFGKTNLPLYAGEWQSFNALYGTTSNPWDASRTPGGSSGGAAASLAAGYTALELGSDIGGSIRIPAHFCGVVGHKPTHGIIPLRGHIPGPPGALSEPDLAVAGPMARSVRDVAMMLDLLVGPGPEEAVAWSIDLPPPRVTQLGDFRAAVWTEDPLCPVEAEVRDVLDRALARLADEGLQIVDGKARELDLERLVDPYLRLLAAEIGAGLPAALRRRLHVLRPLVHLQARYGLGGISPLLPAYLDGVLQSKRRWMATHERRQRLKAKMAAWFEDVDVLLMPVAPWAAFPHTHDADVMTRKIPVGDGKVRNYIDHLPWIAPATVLGLPGTSVPVGKTRAGLPVNLQVVGARYQDRTCLALAAEVERVFGGFEPPPGFEASVSQPR